MKLVTIGTSLVISTLVSVLVLTGERHYHPQKHTQQCMVIYREGAIVWFARPDRELFEMYFDNPPAILQPGMNLRDLTYTDDNANMRHFVKMQVADQTVKGAGK